MRRGAVIDPRMYEAIPEFFPQTLDIINPEGEEENEAGQIIPGEEVIYDDLSCNVAAAGGDEVRDGATSYGLHTHSISVPGLYGVKAGWIARVHDDGDYRILLSEKDSQRSQTRIRCEGRDI